MRTASAFLGDARRLGCCCCLLSSCEPQPGQRQNTFKLHSWPTSPGLRARPGLSACLQPPSKTRTGADHWLPSGAWGPQGWGAGQTPGPDQGPAEKGGVGSVKTKKQAHVMYRTACGSARARGSEKETRVTHGTACRSAWAQGSDQASVTSAHRASCTFLRRCVEPHNPQAGLRSLPPFGRSTGAWPVSASADRGPGHWWRRRGRGQGTPRTPGCLAAPSQGSVPLSSVAPGRSLPGSPAWEPGAGGLFSAQGLREPSWEPAGSLKKSWVELESDSATAVLSWLRSGGRRAAGEPRAGPRGASREPPAAAAHGPARPGPPLWAHRAPRQRQQAPRASPGSGAPVWV